MASRFGNLLTNKQDKPESATNGKTQFKTTTFSSIPPSRRLIMPSSGGCCGRRTAAVLLLLSAVPFALIAHLELSSSNSASSYHYQTRGWLRECAKWDAPRRRFLVSTFFDGGVAEVVIPETGGSAALEDRTVISDPDMSGNSSLGIAIDSRRGRLLVVYGDSLGNRHAAVGAYDLVSADRIFLSLLSGPGDEKSLADDVAVDEDGNAYVTDAKSNKIWKLGLKGELLSVIRSPTFVQRKEWYSNLVGLNGIVYHPNGYLLVIHTTSGVLFKIDTVKEDVSVVKVKGSLFAGDGLELLSPTKLVVAGTPSARVVESSDEWETAIVTERYIGPLHRVASSATVKDGKVYLNHLFGGGLKKWKHVIVEAVFTPVVAK